MSLPGLRSPSRSAWLLTLVAIAGCGLFIVQASDHSDAPASGAIPRQDANLTDFYAFIAGPNLVLALCTNPAIPPGVGAYVFPTDVTFQIHVDLDAAVGPDDPRGDGGTILNPERLGEEISYRIRFRADGSMRMQYVVHGVPRSDPQPVNLFAGLRDDPFIRGPRIGRNVAAIVFEVPLSSVVRDQSTVVLWATSRVEEFDGPFQDLAGRALRSMFVEQNAMNYLHPRLQFRRTGDRPDVMILDTAMPVLFPNGRALVDDIVDMVGDPRVLLTDYPFPSENDVPFLPVFPYLAPPQ